MQLQRPYLKKLFEQHHENLKLFYLGQLSERNSQKLHEDVALDDEKKGKHDKVLFRNDISFTIPGCNNQVYVGKNENRNHQYMTKDVCCEHTRNFLVF